jgi:hypothetical protein
VIQIPVDAGFTSGVNQLGFGLLDQAGFFEAFNFADKAYTIEAP